MRLEELKSMLLEREYPPGIIDAAIAKARAVPRSVALRRWPRQHTNTILAFVVGYDPRLPSISKITKETLAIHDIRRKISQQIKPHP